MKRLLITFGCSWTFGVGAGYAPAMSLKEYRDIAWDTDLCDQLSFRNLLCKKYDLTNINFSEGGSSNQRQFRKAKEFFSSREFKRIRNQYNQILVLWGITSTARNEAFLNDHGEVTNFFYNGSPFRLAKTIVVDAYDHDHEVFCLATEMLHWNDFFENLNVKNLWFDTFNHYDYHLPSPNILKFEHEYKVSAGKDWPTWEQFLTNDFDVAEEIMDELFTTTHFKFSRYITSEQKISNLIFNDKSPRDLLSVLATANGLAEIDNKYHESRWAVDSNRVEHLIKIGMLNPFSMHPTQLGHQQLAEILSAPLEQLMNT